MCPSYQYPIRNRFVRILGLLLLMPAVGMVFSTSAASAETMPDLQYEWGCIEYFNGDGELLERCGLGYLRTLCGWNAGVEECETFFEIVDEDEPGPEPVSNVLFLPGIKGSRLYRADANCESTPGDCVKKLWEPYGNADAQQLFLGEDGRAQYTDIYAVAGGVLSAALGQRFYASFITDLNDLMESESLGVGWRWEAGAYDWRLSLTDIITRGDREDERIYFDRTSEAPYLETQLRNLALDSPTGKVTIIAHSNGGLVAKALIDKLENEAVSLVDKVIFVGVPHLGAPQALGALLFGHGEALPFDGCATARLVSELCSLLMDRPTARTFAEHAPMAYHLLPSHSYFEASRNAAFGSETHSLVRFTGNEHYQSEQVAYGQTIDSEAELHGFATASEAGRSKPNQADIAQPNVLSPSLLSYAEDIHDWLDAWHAPAGISVHHLIGWGKETISGIEFYEEPSVLGLIGSAVPRYRPLFQFEGDGVVPSLSARGIENVAVVTSRESIPLSAANVSLSEFGIPSDQRYWIDLSTLNANRIGGGYGHGTLFEVDEVRELLTNLIGAAHGTELTLPANVHTAEPSMPTERSWLRIFLHSPLTLELYAGEKHLGMTAEGGFDNEIPGAIYDEFGEVKYITAPGGEPYTVTLRAYEAGSFSLDIQEVSGRYSTTTSVLQVPVTRDSVVHITLPAHHPSETSLMLDRDGNGTIDEEIVLAPGAVTAYVPEKIGSPPADREIMSEREGTQSVVEAELDSSSTSIEPIQTSTSTPSLTGPSSGQTPEVSTVESISTSTKTEPGEVIEPNSGAVPPEKPFPANFALVLGALAVIVLLLFYTPTSNR